MGVVRDPNPVKLFAGVLAQRSALARLRDLLEAHWGAADHEGESFDFCFSDYYRDECGPDLVRQFYSFEKVLDPLEVREHKILSNEIERDTALGGRRPWNIDPGYVDLDKVVLATTKPATYRIYLGDGIYAQSTLYFKDGNYHPWPWTYPDYREEKALQFFCHARGVLKKQLKDEILRAAPSE